MDQDEPLQHAAERELKEETSLDAKDLLFTQVRAPATACCSPACKTPI